MLLPTFELACLVVVLCTLAIIARGLGLRALLAEYAALAAAAWLGEESCILAYRFYAYAPGWHARLGEVPLLVPLIWPLVILSARAVSAALWPGAGPASRALLVAAIVSFDASMIEVIAVRAGLWTWAEGGHLGVPPIGVLGWGFFALATEALRLARRRRLALVVLAPAATHLMLLGSWWGLWRWVLRGPLGSASVAAIALFGAAALAPVVRARSAGLALPPAVAAPRILASALFLGLLWTTRPLEPAVWIHVASLAVPYLLATRFTTPSSAAAPAGARPPSRAGTG